MSFFKFPIILAFAFSLISNLACAGRGGTADTGGGDAVISAQAVKLLDLAEKEGFALEAQSSYQNQTLPRLQYLEKFYLAYHGQYHQYDKLMRYLSEDLGEAKRSLLWFWVKQPLPEINDEGSDNYFISIKGQKVQLALQMDGNVYVREDIYSQMDEQNQGALFLHELMLNVAFRQAMSSQETYIGADQINLKQNGTAKIRSFVSLLMTPDYLRLTMESMRLQLQKIGIQDVVATDCWRQHMHYPDYISNCYRYETEIAIPRFKALDPYINFSGIVSTVTDEEKVRIEFLSSLRKVAAISDLHLSQENSVKILLKVIENTEAARNIPKSTLSRYNDLITEVSVELRMQYAKNSNIFQRVLKSDPDISEEASRIAARRAFNELISQWEKEEERSQYFTIEFNQRTKSAYRALLE
jgi:hypothetical protein